MSTQTDTRILAAATAASRASLAAGPVLEATAPRAAAARGTTTRAARPRATRPLVAGRILGGAAVLFLAVDGAMKLAGAQAVALAAVQLGWPADVMVGLGAILLAGVVLHVVPRTAVLGALLITGYLGGAVATHVRIGDPLFSHVLFPVYVGALLWGGLLLRDARLRQFLPWRRRGA